MNEWNIPERKYETSLDDQLAAYYGQEIPEQPLSSAVWYKLRAKLPRQRSFRYWPLHIRRRRIKCLHIPRISYGVVAPAYIQDAFNHIAHEARLSYTSAMLHCTFKKRVRIPSVHVVYWGRQKIHLLLPASPTSSLESAELNVLLASGLAYHLCLFERKLPFGFVRILAGWVCILALIALILVGWDKFTPIALPIASVFLTILLYVLVLSHRQGRALAFRVDALAAQWLGRSQMCEGLHALVRRCHHPQRKGLGQVSFAERIQRVCDMQIPVENERLTLVH